MSKLRLLVLAAICSYCSVGVAFAQEVKVTPSSTIVYAVKKGFFSSEFPYKVIHTASGFDFYDGKSLMLFDPKTFTYVHLLKREPDFDAKLVVTGDAGNYKVGNSWETAFEEPPGYSARCSENTKKTTKVTIEDVKQTKVKFDDADVDAQVVAAKVSGTWSSCGYSGTFDRDTKYSPTLGIWNEGVSTTYMEGRVLDKTASVLVHIKSK